MNIRILQCIKLYYDVFSHLNSCNFTVELTATSVAVNLTKEYKNTDHVTVNDTFYSVFTCKTGYFIVNLTVKRYSWCHCTFTSIYNRAVKCSNLCVSVSIF